MNTVRRTVLQCTSHVNKLQSFSEDKLDVTLLMLLLPTCWGKFYSVGCYQQGFTFKIKKIKKKFCICVHGSKERATAKPVLRLDHCHERPSLEDTNCWQVVPYYNTIESVGKDHLTPALKDYFFVSNRMVFQHRFDFHRPPVN